VTIALMCASVLLVQSLLSVTFFAVAFTGEPLGWEESAGTLYTLCVGAMIMLLAFGSAFVWRRRAATRPHETRTRESASSQGLAVTSANMLDVVFLGAVVAQVVAGVGIVTSDTLRWASAAQGVASLGFALSGLLWIMVVDSTTKRRLAVLDRRSGALAAQQPGPTGPRQ
jgi:hypothetical protein